MVLAEKKREGRSKRIWGNVMAETKRSRNPKSAWHQINESTKHYRLAFNNVKVSYCTYIVVLYNNDCWRDSGSCKLYFSYGKHVW